MGVDVAVWLDGLNLREFLSTHQEWHALVEGFCENACPLLKPRYSISDALKKDIEDEHHYYMPGRVLGVLFFIGLTFGVAVGIVKIIEMALRMVHLCY